MKDFIPMICIIVFFALLLVINRKNMGVKNFDEYATSNGAFGFISITFAVLATWYVGSSFTAFATSGVLDGVQMAYVIPYATFSIVVMMFFGDRTWAWGKKHGFATQADLIGYRYQSKLLQFLTGAAGIVFVAPWLMLEWVVQGYIWHYATGGRISTTAGMIIGAVVVLVYVSLGGMKSVITANLLQGVLMIFGGTALFVWMVNQFWGGIGNGYEMLLQDAKEFLSYPGVRSTTPLPGWTSMVMASAFGAWTWPWAFNKTFTASGPRELKKTALLAPILGATFWLFLTVLGNVGYTVPYVVDHPNEVFVYLAKQCGVWPLAFMAVIIMAVSAGTVSGMIQGISASFTRDIAPAFKKDLTDKQNINLSRAVTVVISIILIIWAITAGEGQSSLTIVLLTYQGIIQLFPCIALGLYWRKADLKGALIGFVVGTILAMYWNLHPMAWMTETGWSGGMVALAINFIIMLVFGLINKNTKHADDMFAEFAAIKALSRKKNLSK